MADSKVNVPDTTSGTEAVRTFEVTVGADSVHVQGVALVDPATGAARGPLTDAELRAAEVATRQPDATASGSLAALNAAVEIDLAGKALGTVAWDVRGTFSATYVFEGSTDGTNWVGMWLHNNAAFTSNAASVGSSTSSGIVWTGACAGFAKVRVRCSAFTSGSITVTGRAVAVAAPLLPNLTDTSGRQVVVGAAADGAAPVGNPVSVAGKDPAGNTRIIATETTGRVQTLNEGGYIGVQSTHAVGTAHSANAHLMGGSDGTNLQRIRVDADGHLQVAGTTAVGAAPVGNPLLVAGWDGVGARILQTDNGFLRVQGRDSAGVAPTGMPMLVAGSDGSAVRTLNTNGSGQLALAGHTSPGQPQGADMLRVGGTDGTTARMVRTDDAGALAVGNSAKATYVASVASKAVTGNSNVIAIEAGAAKTVRICKVVIVNPGMQTTAGLRMLALVRTTAAGAGGFTLTPARMQTTDPAFTGIAREMSGGTDGETLMQIPVFVPSAVGAFEPLVIDFDDVAKRPTVEPGTANGITLKDPGAAGASDFAAYIVFTEE